MSLNQSTTDLPSATPEPEWDDLEDADPESLILCIQDSATRLEMAHCELYADFMALHRQKVPFNPAPLLKLYRTMLRETFELAATFPPNFADIDSEEDDSKLLNGSVFDSDEEDLPSTLSLSDDDDDEPSVVASISGFPPANKPSPPPFSLFSSPPPLVISDRAIEGILATDPDPHPLEATLAHLSDSVSQLDPHRLGVDDPLTHLHRHRTDGHKWCKTCDDLAFDAYAYWDTQEASS